MVRDTHEGIVMQEEFDLANANMWDVVQGKQAELLTEAERVLKGRKTRSGCRGHEGGDKEAGRDEDIRL